MPYLAELWNKTTQENMEAFSLRREGCLFMSERREACIYINFTGLGQEKPGRRKKKMKKRAFSDSEGALKNPMAQTHLFPTSC